MRAPGKVAYRELESDAELEFALYLADRLGLTLAQVHDMPYSEFILWSRYHARRKQERELAQLRAGG